MMSPNVGCLMLRVLSDVNKCAFRAFKYSSWTVPVAHKSFSIAAAIRDERSAERDKLKAI